MAIKINWKDLAKRIVDGKEVERVILDWAEIWPNPTPHINYHVINDFTGTTGTYPSGWTGGTWVWISPSGMYSITWQNATATYTMPSLMNAKKITIISKFHWEPWYDINRYAIRGGFPSYEYEWAQYDPSYWMDHRSSWALRAQIATSGVWNDLSQTPTTWDYELEYTMYLTPLVEHENLLRLVVKLKDSNGTTFFNDWWPYEEGIKEATRHATYFYVTLWQWVTVSSIDFYIYNN